MNHDEAALLLGAYALDALEEAEAAQLELHLRDCPRCRAELAAHREVAGALGDSTTSAPEGLWERIAQHIASDEQAGAPRPLPELINLNASVPAARRWHPVNALLAGVGAVAAAAVLVLGLFVAHLNGELNGLQQSAVNGGLAPLVAATALGPHQEVTLTAAGRATSAKIVIAPSGIAYWAGSSLKELNSQQSYQLWALVGSQLVSLGLIGADPHSYVEFKLAPTMSRVMVTSEPAGGTPRPTTPVLLTATLPTLA